MINHYTLVIIRKIGDPRIVEITTYSGEEK